MNAIHLYCFRIIAILLFLSAMVYPQSVRRASGDGGKAAFITSNYAWKWFQNGSTTFTFSLKNQSGHGVKTVHYRVLFFDRHGSQIDFAEGSSSAIPNGLAHRESVDLDFDTGMSTRKLAAYEKIQILGFDQGE